MIKILKVWFIISVFSLCWWSRYTQSLHQIHQEWLLFPLFLAFFWSVSQRMFLIALLILGIGGSWSYQLFLGTPEIVQKLHTFTEQHSPVWIQGVINSRSTKNNQVTLHILSVKIYDSTHNDATSLHEAQISFQYRGKVTKLYRGRSIQLAGIPEQVFMDKQRLHLIFDELYISDYSPPSSAYSLHRKEVFLKLIERARFYLSPETLKLYLPLTLAKRIYAPEITQLFRQTGMAHILAISGLHIAMIYVLLMFCFRTLGVLFPFFLVQIHFPKVCMAASTFILWAYVALLGFPLPALRAVFMLSLLVLFRISGLVALPMYSLYSCAFVFLAIAPEQIYQLSFQLSFVSVFFILIFLSEVPKQKGSASIHQKVLYNIFANVWITFSVLLGIAPILMTQFQRISFEVIWLNLILIPVLAFWVLPICLLALTYSLWNLNSPAFAGIEQWIYQGVEKAVGLWFALLQYFHSNASWAVLEYSLNWEGWHYILYYSVLALVWLAIKPLRRERNSKLWNSS